ncbi:cell division protein FtsW [Mumia flava]|uniref:Probable peptidoglycan glycosyltransferase FtsW n=1 Tax=Mumia flava TaxID=1348852 RepID=A0A2M9BDI2_9ACTN|nr:putative lipid II flippase FtsW [Mumia flava]PJJ56025.1 cell division protein FtsW [Mumia flava]
MARAADRTRPSDSVPRLGTHPLTSYYLVLAVSALLVGFGMVMVLSSSSVTSYDLHGSPYTIASRQAIFLVVALLASVVVWRLPIRVIRAFAYPLLLVALALLAATFTPLGSDVNGNRNWIDVGAPFLIQPSEIAKLAVVVWSADLFARKLRLLDRPKHVWIPMMPVTFGVAMVVVLQRDLGTAVVLFAIILGMLFAAGLPGRHFLVAFLLLAAVALAFVRADEERISRLTSFTDPFADPTGAGYQAAHGLMGLATGGLWGVGLGGSRQKWGALPEAHTDFVFAVIGEELGLIGALGVLVLYGLLAYAGFRIARRAGDPFARFAAAGITVWILVQTLINVGMVIGVAPVIGIPLPLISYGGSALAPTVVALALLANFARTEPGAAAALRAQRERRQRRRSHDAVAPPTGAATRRPAVRRVADPRPRTGGVPAGEEG